MLDACNLWLFEHSLALPFCGIGMKTDFSSPVATALFVVMLPKAHLTLFSRTLALGE